MLAADACFKQSRLGSGQGETDAPIEHPANIFLHQSYLDEVEQQVLRLRNPSNERPARQRLDPVTLVACTKGHVAANENRAKTNKTVMEDTGLMALVCRHDIPILVANMKTAGERQFYAIALIKRLFELIPKSWTLTLLYDIACVLEYSAEKWNFLGSDFNRITWAVSIFHAYGHEYPCQVVYHPRFTVGCALFDGEGCERLWNLLRFLIALLRISGVSDYHGPKNPTLTCFVGTSTTVHAQPQSTPHHGKQAG
jgi:hypothetical protein